MNHSSNCRIVILISGSGTNLQTIIESTLNGSINGRVVGVISNKADAYGLVRAENAGIQHSLIEHQQYTDREDFDNALSAAIDGYQADLIVLAGFMRILGKTIAEKFKGKMLNIHPSLLPKYQGLHTHRRALEANDQFHGASIHFVTEELDGGPIVAQGKISIESEDTELSLSRRVQQIEYKLYPEVISWFCESRLKLTKDGPKLDDKLLLFNSYF